MSGGDNSRVKAELDKHVAVLQSIRDYLVLDEAESRRLWDALAALRGDLRALANRVEALTQAVGYDGVRYSLRAPEAQCAETSPTYGLRCAKPPGHPGQHESQDRVYWGSGGGRELAASRRELDEELVVVDLEAELPTVVGLYLDTVEDGVRYLDREGGSHVAPVDCVRVLTRRELRETRREAGRP